MYCALLAIRERYLAHLVHYVSPTYLHAKATRVSMIPFCLESVFKIRQFWKSQEKRDPSSGDRVAASGLLT